MAAVATYVLDTSAVVSYLEGSDGHHKVVRLIQEARRGSALLLMSAVNWGEVFYSMAVGRTPEEMDVARTTLARLPITMVEVDTARAEGAAKVKLRYKMGYADAFATALALENNASIVTRDSDFKRVQGRIKIVWLTPGRGANR